MQIKKLLTKVNVTKFSGQPRAIKYIVIHYTANKGDTALNNAKYFENVNRNSSAHYFVDENEIYQIVEDNDISWHCGVDYSKGKAKYWNICKNMNSIGIEMCSDYDKDYYISKKTMENTIELTKELMGKYNIPIENVVRHYDVTGKNCPAPWVKDNEIWNEFKKQLASNEITNAIDKLSNKGIITNPEFWKKNYNTSEGQKYIKDLIVKFANYI